MKSEKSRKIFIGIASGVCALAVAVLVFFAGYWVRGIVGVNSYDWVLGIINEHYYKQVDTQNADRVSIDALVKEYLDIYSAYYTAEEYAALQNSNAGNASGLGITVTYIDGVGLLVSQCVGNSPAYLSGLRTGDMLDYGVSGGQRTDFDSLSDFSAFADAADGEIEFVTTQGERFVAERAQYATSYVFMATADSTWSFTGSDALTLTENDADRIEYLPEGTAYISLSQFYGNAPEQFGKAVEQFNAEGCTSLILDLRNDGGGYVDVMQKISSYFENCAGGSVAMTAVYGDGSAETYPIKSMSGGRISADTDVYVLANSNTASASEALIGCLVSYEVTDYDNIYISQYSQSYLDATGYTAEQLKSGKTYGKGIMQTTFTNPLTGEALKLTTAQIYWPNGKTIHDVGLTAEDGCRIAEAPYPISGAGEELRSVVSAIFG